MPTIVRWDLVRTLVPWLVIGAGIGAAGVGSWRRPGCGAAFGLFQVYVGLSMLFKRTRGEARRLPGGAPRGWAWRVLESVPFRRCWASAAGP